MDNQEAKFILKAYRPNGADAGDSVFADALEQAKRDPSLGQWLAREQAFDRAIAAKLGQTPIPPGLRQSILAGARVSTTPAKWWKQPRWLGLAASVLVVFSVGLFAIRYFHAEESTRFAAFAVNDLLHGRHGGDGEVAAKMQAMLSAPTAKLTAGLPVDFEALRSTGCRTLKFRGHDVLEICLHRANGVVHLYVLRKEDFPAAGSTPRISESEGVFLASWSDARNTFLAATGNGRQVLEQFL